MTRAPLVALAAALALTGCRGDPPPREPKVIIETRFLERLSAAIKGVNDARKRLADDANTLVAAARALDAVDEVAVTGDRQAARARRPAAVRATAAAAIVARRLNQDVAAYEKAVAALDAAEAPGLTPEQLDALRAAAQAGRAEVTALRRYAAAVTGVWGRYEELDADQKLWLTRASNGWYRNQKEAAGAYAVLTDRTRLATARRTFAAADGRRVEAGRTATAVFNAARAVLAPLLS